MRLIDELTLIASSGGIVGGAAALWMGLRHNPQGELYVADTGRLDLRYCGMVFGVWFAVAGAATLLVALAVTAVLRARARRA